MVNEPAELAAALQRSRSARIGGPVTFPAAVKALQVLGATCVEQFADQFELQDAAAAVERHLETWAFANRVSAFTETTWSDELVEGVEGLRLLAATTKNVDMLTAVTATIILVCRFLRNGVARASPTPTNAVTAALDLILADESGFIAQLITFVPRAQHSEQEPPHE